MMLQENTKAIVHSADCDTEFFDVYIYIYIYMKWRKLVWKIGIFLSLLSTSLKVRLLAKEKVSVSKKKYFL